MKGNVWPENRPRGLLIVSEGKEFSVTASFGISESTADDDSVESLIKRCDQALYEAKERGRNCVVSKTYPV